MAKIVRHLPACFARLLRGERGYRCEGC